MKNLFRSFLSLLVLLFTFLMSNAQDTIKKNSAEKDVAYTIIEEMPRFPGGEKGMYSFINSTIRYPERAMENHIEGTVSISFDIDTDGTVLNPKILSGLGSGCDEEALRIIQLMPKWIPGKRNGLTVKMKRDLSIKFKIKTPEEIQDSEIDGVYFKGVILLNQGKYKESIAEFDKVITAHQFDGSAYYNRGLAKYEMNDRLNACRDWSYGWYYSDTVLSAFQINAICDGIAILDEDTFAVPFSRSRDRNAVTVNSNDRFIYTVVDHMPSFKGGENAMLDFIVKHVKYPKEAREKKITGRVYTRFYVSRTGKVSHPFIKKGVLGGGLNEEALRVVRMMPAWEPGVQNGKAVDVFFYLPINFSLK